MKKIKRFAYAGAVILLSAGFAACSSTDDALENVNYIDKGVVKTEFNITIPGRMATRMSDEQVQYHATADALPTFRGLNNIYLIPFSKAGTVSEGVVTNSEYVIASTDGRLGDRLSLLNTNGKSSPQISTDYSVATSLTNRKNLSQVYMDVEVPIGTRSFLFYGVAPDATATAPVTTEELNGKLTATGLTGNPTGIEFALQTIQTSSANDMRTNILAYLNSIVNAGDWKIEGKELNEMFIQFTSNHAGSSADVQALVQDLYTALLPYTSTNAMAIKTAIESTTYVQSITDGVINFNTSKLGDVSPTANFTAAFPGVLYLPDGAAYLNYSDGAFSYVDTGMDNVNQIAKVADYVYPASLYYRANSTISVAEESLLDTYTDTSNSWADVLNAYKDAEGGVAQGAVSSETKSVAVEDQVQYAVARMDLNVASDVTLKDTEEKAFNVAEKTFTVTGVLVGGQRKVDYLFNPIIGTSSPQFTIWDNQVKSNVKLSSGDPTIANRTLVLETPSTEKVKFAIEFRNDSGEDFYGKNGIVPAGCKFYLIGEIDPTATATTTYNKYVRPHNTVNASGAAVSKKTTDDIDQVFVQDYVTIVNATVGSLKNAYNVIPDLRAPQLEIGLSVNLKWEAANTYSVALD